jgi:hypothetical protein
MNNIIIEYAEKTGYNKNYVISVMAKDYLGKYFGFRKSGLDELLEYKKLKLADFVKEVYSKAEHKNKTVQISKLLNKKQGQAKYYTELDLANDLAHWINLKKKPGDPLITPNYFLGTQPTIKCVGALTGNGQVNLYKKSEQKDILVISKYADCVCVINKTQLLNGLCIVYKANNFVDPKADNRLSFCQDVKSKIVYHGYLELLSNGNYDVIDRSVSTGKQIGKLAENIKLAWSSQALQGFYPSWDQA